MKLLSFFHIIIVWIIINMMYSSSIVAKVVTKLSRRVDFRQVVRLNKKVAGRMIDPCSQDKIVGGEALDISVVPYQVNIRTAHKRKQSVLWDLLCGGSIVTATHIISAAHCFDHFRRSATRVVAGTTKSTVVLKGSTAAQIKASLKKVQQFETWRSILSCNIHPKYNAKRVTADFAVLEIVKPLPFGIKIRPIRIASPYYKPIAYSGTQCIASGFGLTKDDAEEIPPTLRMVCIPVVNYGKCKKFYGGLSATSMICAGKKNKDTCPGDSGGPLACTGELMGITSFGGVCGESPGVYTYVPVYARLGIMSKCNLSNQVKYNIFEIAAGLLICVKI